MERITVVRAIIDGLIERITVGQDRDVTSLKRKEFIHSYGTALLARLLALKRGLDQELASVAGHLHDIGRVVHGTVDDSHSTIGALEAERELRKIHMFSEAEISTICYAIRAHNAKGIKNGPYEELIKDATLLEKYLHHPNYQMNGEEQSRLMQILADLGMA